MELTGPPGHYRARTKYSAAHARRYQRRSSAKHRAEMRLMRRVAKLVQPGTLLDIACGGGRMGMLFAGLGHRVTCADWSENMLAITRENVASAGLPIQIERQDVEAISHADRSFDAVLCFRLFHHFPDASVRARAVGELCRVARHTVILSYWSPYSLSLVKRTVHGWRVGRPSPRVATPRREVEGYFRANGFELVRDFAQLRYLAALHVAVFRRQ